LDSLRQVEYPLEDYSVVVIADRCTDGTVFVAEGKGVVCFTRLHGQPGKGAALAWGIQKAIDANISFDAVVVVDADTIVDRSLLSAFDAQYQLGHQIQQGYNYLSNPWSSPFTRIIAVTGALRNGRFYAGKTVLGLSGMLTGTGMCLSAEVLRRHGWTAFSVGEDWELSVDLLLKGEHIYFNSSAKTFARESQTLKQASHQRLRWASGRYAVMGSAAWALVAQGIRKRSLALVDSAVTLVAPNYSTQASLSLLCFAGSWSFSGDQDWGFILYWAGALLLSVAGYFILGVFSTESPARAIVGLMLVPIFLPWRLAIEILGMLGFGRKSWGRMSRSVPPPRQAN
jgi:cellulose synthase/poly-beta-1,6-N-acetylglucosamine synthase-like glycosyltransferase